MTELSRSLPPSATATSFDTMLSVPADPAANEQMGDALPPRPTADGYPVIIGIRHGFSLNQSQRAQEQAHPGSVDPVNFFLPDTHVGLDELGVTQFQTAPPFIGRAVLESLGLTPADVGVIISSAYLRALESTDALAPEENYPGAAVYAETRAGERDQGDAGNMTREAFAELYPDSNLVRLLDPANWTAPGSGESMTTMRDAQVTELLALIWRISRRAGAQAIILVAHGEIINALKARYLNYNFADMYDFLKDPKRREFVNAGVFALSPIDPATGVRSTSYTHYLEGRPYEQSLDGTPDPQWQRLPGRVDLSKQGRLGELIARMRKQREQMKEDYYRQTTDNQQPG